jgi:hypothetical protein
MNKSMVELLLLVSLIVAFGCQVYMPFTWYSVTLTISCVIFGAMLYKYIYNK